MRVGHSNGAWTVLVYMAADDGHGVFTNAKVDIELAAIEEAVNAHPETRIVVQADRRGSTTVRGLVENGHFQRRKHQEVVSGSHNITEFLTFARLRHPDDNYLVIFWGHGFGPAGLHYEGEFVDPVKLGKALRAAFFVRPVDVVTFMSCHMSTIELAHEFNALLPAFRAANYVVASEGLVRPKEAFPYAELFEVLDGRPAAKTVGQRLVDILGGTRYDAPFSLLDVSLSVDVRKALMALANVLVDENPFLVHHPLPTPLRDALHGALGVAKTDEAALLDLVRLGREIGAIRANPSQSRQDATQLELAQNACRRLVGAVDRKFVVHTGPSAQGAPAFNGVSAFCPTHHQQGSLVENLVNMNDYRKLSFAQPDLFSSDKSWVDVVALAQ